MLDDGVVHHTDAVLRQKVHVPGATLTVHLCLVHNTHWHLLPDPAESNQDYARQVHADLNRGLDPKRVSSLVRGQQWHQVR